MHRAGLNVEAILAHQLGEGNLLRTGNSIDDRAFQQADLPTEILYGRQRRKAARREPAVPEGPDNRGSIQDLEKPMVLQALALADGDRERAAELLHIDVSALEDLIRRNKIET